MHGLLIFYQSPKLIVKPESKVQNIRFHFFGFCLKCQFCIHNCVNAPDLTLSLLYLKSSASSGMRGSSGLGSDMRTWRLVRQLDRLMDGFQEPCGGSWNTRDTIMNTSRAAVTYLQDVQTGSAPLVHVGVVDFGGEPHLGRLEGVSVRHEDLEPEDAALVGMSAVTACMAA